MSDIVKFLKGFVYAGRGVLSTIKTERNMRVHLTFLVYMFSILLSTDWFVLSSSDWVALVIISAIVISGELVNTAIENTVDMFTEGKYNEYAKKAKDAASGAVLISAIASVIVGIKIMFQPKAFVAMYEYFVQNPLMLIPFGISLVVAITFIFKFGKSK